MRRIFSDEFGVSPIDYAQTQRLLLAKRLLTDTTLPVTDVALTSGFASVRRFNAAFKTRYRMAPTRLRRAAAPAALPAVLEFDLPYRPPYDFPAMLAFLARRAVQGVEQVDAKTYRRTLHIEHAGSVHRGYIEVFARPARNALRLRVSASLARVVPHVLSLARQAFDVACDPSEIAARLGELATRKPGLRVPGTFDGFELATRAVLGQQVSVRAATTLAARLAEQLGDPLDHAPHGLARTFPAASVVAGVQDKTLAALGILPARARTVRALAQAVAEGKLELDVGADVERARATLSNIPGIGPWTIEYIAMRALGWPDAFPASDLGILKAMAETKPSKASARSESWRPWRAYAVMHLWSRHDA
ncbi:MAG TPA: DNA-3-methyladenine glycosylase 2 [Casimicrobiaceae bacterium]|nr:DNA-3-methyladenine glycosylase 2 [Casimicrobiaceae bacterium]